jgi:putative membrane-bound dehydrogenase-like protein
LLLAGASEFALAVDPVAKTDVITNATKDHSSVIEADISGAKNLYLVVTDGGNGFACDWADWADPTLTGPKGKLKLTDLKWKSASSGWGQVMVDRNANGGPLRIAGNSIGNGIGTHANSVIHFELPEGYTKFTATVGIDNGGSDQGGGSSIQFAVYTQKPSRILSGPTRDPEDAVAALDVPEDLEVSLFAAEPMLLSPSNIDIDHLGRIWVCEVVNYRHFANANNPAREEGDRILILEDTDGDGTADKETTFYQGRDIDSAHGVCVLGNRVIVSAGDSVFSFYDDDGDLKADRKEVLFTGIKGVQHDHGIHSFTFGVDGRLYFNFGNNGEELHTPDGSVVMDVSGHEVRIHRQPYQEGMAFRCELDGSKVDTIGWNFRNNWELCVDSFGTVWQSDNDDDGNKGVRINYVMEYGNFGYKDEFTGAGWREARTGWEAEIPHRHWHLNDPGVVPNLLQTGAGSPTGIICYEGDLLPERFHNQLIHCDAGPNVVRSYAVSDDGAGYRAEINNILTGSRDQWFRPSDVCVAPDGSLIVADWYDPGVGGHRQGDVERGRLFRVAPPGSPYTFSKPDFSTVEGAAAALKSPNVATRYLAFTALKEAGAGAEPTLARMFESDPNPRFRARAYWLLGQIDGKTQQYVNAGAADKDANIRIAAVRLARRMELDVVPVIEKLVTDESAQVRRECAIALRPCDSDQRAALWGKLAAQLDPADRWYLEALGIGAEGLGDQALMAYFKAEELHRQSPSQGNQRIFELAWRVRSPMSVKTLEGALKEAKTEEDAAHYFRALDFQPKDAVGEALSSLLAHATRNSSSPVAGFILAESLKRVSGDPAKDATLAASINAALKRLRGTSQFVELIERFGMEDHYGEVLLMAQQNADRQIGVEAIRSLLRLKQWRLLSGAIKGDDTETALATVRVMGNSLDGAIGGVLVGVIKDGAVNVEVRREAVRAAANVPYAAKELASMAENNTLDAELTQALAAAMHVSRSGEIREIASRMFPLPPAREGKPLPPISQLIGMKGDATNGRLVFNTTGTCHKCHVVNKIGREVGPDLSEIGSKLSRQAMFESIIYPSAGISHNYESYTLLLASGTTVTGLITSETDDSISIKGDDAIIRTFNKDEIDEKVKQKISMMPADLQKVMTVQETIDVVDYLQTLKKK